MQVLMPNFKRRGGKLPVVIQSEATREILSLEHATETQWRTTLLTGGVGVHFVPQNLGVVEMLINCDGTALVYTVRSFGHPIGLWLNQTPHFEKEDSIVTAIAQDVSTLEVLMLAYAKRVAWDETMRTGYATYWKTSSDELWVKGATSDNKQRLVRYKTNNQSAALVYEVEPEGHKCACHTDARSCFYRTIGNRQGMPAPHATQKDDLPLIEADAARVFW